MSSYVTLAHYYDCLTEDVDFKVRSDYISNFFSRYGKGDLTLLDLACGTGNISQHLSKKGYEIVGIDISEEMLTEANSKGIENALFVKGDISDFQMPYMVNFCVCSLDSINHLQSIEAITNCFKCVYSSMYKNGIFVFDVNTIYKNEKILGNNTFIYDEDDYYLCWDNEYIGDGKVNMYLDFFVYNGKNYDRCSEQITEVAYDTQVLTQALADSGFQVIGIYNDLTLDPPKDDSERLYFVCKRK